MIITVVNQKGGVGKTTTAVNLAYFLAQTKNVALIDLDPEGGTTASFGIRRDKRELKLGEKSVNIFNVELYPAHVGLLNLELSGEVDSTVETLKEISKSYDITVIDTPPNLGTLAVSAMIAGDKILTPVTPQPLALQVTRNLGERLTSLKKTAYAITNMSNKPVNVEIEGIKSLEIAIPQNRIFVEASKLGVPALRFEEFKTRRPRLTEVFERIAKVVLS
ncbi:MAG: ParA family protein [Thermoprotei archaeon]